jgi:cAMP-dependent protein kinase regulator
MFAGLSDADFGIVADAMTIVKPGKGEVICEEGKDGDDMYVVEAGVFRCIKTFKGDFEPTFLKNFESGDAFGELALLYNAPRAATLCSEKNGGILYRLDRNTFNHIVKDANRKKREKYEDFLSKISILAEMDNYERSKLADAFIDHDYEPGDIVIKEGDEGKELFFIAEGEAIATKEVEAGKAPVEVMQYKTGDYFGEMALLKDEPRAANVIAKTKLMAVSLERHAFKRLLGPVEEILKRNMD